MLLTLLIRGGMFMIPNGLLPSTPIFMLEPGNIIDIDESRKPFNTYMRLSLDLLQIILPVIQPELMKGLIDNDNNNNVMLHLNLAQEKIKQVRQISKSFEKHHNVLIK